jgi:cyclic pyranopterin phosphate synthase
MPKEIFDNNYPYLPQSDLLSFEEIVRIAKIFVSHGVSKIRLTGGEPLLRKNIEVLVKMLSELRSPDGKLIDLTLTTNGALLARKAKALKEAGLHRITVSLDALDDAIFKRMNDVDFPVNDVLHGIKVAQEAGFETIKINMVVKAGINEQEIIPMARFFQTTPHILRFIEYMDVGASNAWKLDEVISNQRIIAQLTQAGMPLIALAPEKPGETAQRFKYASQASTGRGEIGFISSVSNAFCHDCNRARLSTQGKLYTCLFASEGYDLRALMRNPMLEQADLSIANVIATIWRTRSDRYSEIRSQITNEELAGRKKIEMSYIGG